MNARLLGEAWRRWRSPSTADTYIAVVLVAVVVAPLAWRAMRQRNRREVATGGMLTSTLIWAGGKRGGSH